MTQRSAFSLLVGDLFCLTTATTAAFLIRFGWHAPTAYETHAYSLLWFGQSALLLLVFSVYGLYRPGYRHPQRSQGETLKIALLVVGLWTMSLIYLLPPGQLPIVAGFLSTIASFLFVSLWRRASTRFAKARG